MSKLEDVWVSPEELLQVKSNSAFNNCSQFSTTELSAPVTFRNSAGAEEPSTIDTYSNLAMDVRHRFHIVAEDAFRRLVSYFEDRPEEGESDVEGGAPEQITERVRGACDRVLAAIDDGEIDLGLTEKGRAKAMLHGTVMPTSKPLALVDIGDGYLDDLSIVALAALARDLENVRGRAIDSWGQQVAQGERRDDRALEEAEGFKGSARKIEADARKDRRAGANNLDIQGAVFVQRKRAAERLRRMEVDKKRRAERAERITKLENFWTEMEAGDAPETLEGLASSLPRLQSLLIEVRAGNFDYQQEDFTTMAAFQRLMQADVRFMVDDIRCREVRAPHMASRFTVRRAVAVIGAVVAALVAGAMAFGAFYSDEDVNNQGSNVVKVAAEEKEAAFLDKDYSGKMPFPGTRR